MKFRYILWFTALVSSILGALVVYLMLSVPNDLRADGLLKDARKHLNDGKNDQARDALTKIVQQFPRTDAAAAATVALVSLNDKERDELARAIAQLRKQSESQSKVIADLQKSVTEIKHAPAKVVTVTAPPPAKKAPVKKKTTPKKKPVRRRR